MRLDFPLKKQHVILELGNSAEFKEQLLIQNGYFGKGKTITDLDIELDAVANYIPVLERIVQNIPLDGNFTILDIGSGNSIIDLVLSKVLPNSKFILLDGDDWNNNQELHSVDFKPYNRWAHVKNLIEINNLDKNRFRFVGLDYPFNESHDIVISYGSWGLHYPIDTYLSQVVKSLKSSGFLVVAPILNINGSFEKIKSNFVEVDVWQISAEHAQKRNANDWQRLIKYFPKNFQGIWAYGGIWKKL